MVQRLRRLRCPDKEEVTPPTAAAATVPPSAPRLRPPSTGCLLQRQQTMASRAAGNTKRKKELQRGPSDNSATLSGSTPLPTLPYMATGEPNLAVARPEGSNAASKAAGCGLLAGQKYSAQPASDSAACCCCCLELDDATAYQPAAYKQVRAKFAEQC